MEKVLASMRRGNIPRPPLLSCILLVLLLTVAYEFYSMNQHVTSMESSLSDREIQRDVVQQAPNRRPYLATRDRRKKRVLNPHPFSFSMNHPDKCKNEDVFLLIIVTTTPQHHRQRQAIRQTWGKESNIPGVVIKTVFAVGTTDDTAMQQHLEYENEAHGDIIQENFADTHRSLTIKTIMCLKWAFQFCPNAKYVMKVEQDTFVNIFGLVDYLAELNAVNSRKLLLGWVINDTIPVRDPDSEWKQWYVAKEEFPRDLFPPYAGGFAYVMSNDMPTLLYETSLSTKYLFMEDIYIGLCLEKQGIVPRHHSGFCAWHVELDACYFDWLMVSRFVDNSEKVIKDWQALTSKC